MISISSFQPDWISAPGETINDVLESRGMRVQDLANGLEKSLADTHDLLQGCSPIDQHLADRLSNILGASPSFWLKRERQFQEDFDRQIDNNITESLEEWIRSVPFSDMTKFGWLKKESTKRGRIREAFRFFGVANLGDWEARYQHPVSVAAFRATGTFETNPIAVSAWLKQAEKLASRVDCANWDADKLRKNLSEIRSLTRRKDPNHFLPRLRKLLSACGVAFVVVRAPKGCRASGATQFLNGEKAILVSSFRHLSDDHFWFTLFHEIGHLLLHGKEVLFLEDGSDVTELEEYEANQFAEEQLIPPDLRRTSMPSRLRTKSIIRSAGQIGISPGVLVGQMQHSGLMPHNRFNSLKRRYKWQDIELFLSTSE